jgi:hypothetical protein
MHIIKSIFNSESQKAYAASGWIGLRDKTIETFKGAFFVSLIFGTLSLVTSGYLEKVFENGVLEHFAKITIPLAFMTGLIFSGFASLTRRKYRSLFFIFRHISTSCLIFTISLFSILAGLCFGLSLPSIIDGWQQVVLWCFMGSIFYGCVVLCHQIILFNYIYYRKGKANFMYGFGGAMSLLGMVGLFYSLESATSEMVGKVLLTSCLNGQKTVGFCSSLANFSQQFLAA